MGKLEDSLDVCGYSLKAFYDSYHDLLIKKLPLLTGDIRILLVNPISEFSKDRARLEGEDEGQYKNQIERLIRGFRDDATGKIHEKIHIRLLNHPLPSMIFRIDDVLFFGPHMHKITSKSTITFEVEQGARLFDVFKKEFDRMWDDAIEI